MKIEGGIYDYYIQISLQIYVLYMKIAGELQEKVLISNQIISEGVSCAYIIMFYKFIPNNLSIQHSKFNFIIIAAIQLQVYSFF